MPKKDEPQVKSGFGFLKTMLDKVQELNVDAMASDFQPSPAWGHIGPFTSTVLYTVWDGDNNDFEAQIWQEQYEAGLPRPVAHRKIGDRGQRLYFATRDDAHAFIKVALPTSKTQWGFRNIVLRADPSRCVTEFSKKWDIVGDDIDMSSPGSDTTGAVAFHLLYVPSLVQTFAIGLGHLEERIFTAADELARINTAYNKARRQDESTPNPFDDDVQRQFLGVPNAKGLPKDLFGNDGELQRQRAALWAALGCDNPAAFKIPGSSVRAPEVDSEKLAEALLFVGTWPQEFWAEVVSIPIPIAGQYSQATGQQYQAITISRLFEDGLAAEEAANERAELVGGNEPKLPDSWKDTGLDEWLKAIDGITVDDISDELLDSLVVSESELRAWIR